MIGYAIINLHLILHPTLIKATESCQLTHTIITQKHLSCPIPTQALLRLVQHVVDWVAPFLRSQRSPPHPLKFLYTPPPPYVHDS